MNDKELLELAAKAAGIEGAWVAWPFPPGGWFRLNQGGATWNPLTDDGAALRLAVKLNMNVDIVTGASSAQLIGVAFCSEPHQGTDPYAATRRAVVRAAAAIGKDMK